MGRLTRFTAAVTYQMTVLLGVFFMPIALFARQLGLPTPSGRVFGTSGERRD